MEKIQLEVQEEARWDGLYGVCTNIEGKSAEKLFNIYRSLWKIEVVLDQQAQFKNASNLRAHIMICFLSYTILLKLKKAGLSHSMELIDILKAVESFIIRRLCQGLKRRQSRFMLFLRKIQLSELVKT